MVKAINKALEMALWIIIICYPPLLTKGQKAFHLLFSPIQNITYRKNTHQCKSNRILITAFLSICEYWQHHYHLLPFFSCSQYFGLFVFALYTFFANFAQNLSNVKNMLKILFQSKKMCLVFTTVSETLFWNIQLISYSRDANSWLGKMHIKTEEVCRIPISTAFFLACSHTEGTRLMEAGVTTNKRRMCSLAYRHFPIQQCHDEIMLSPTGSTWRSQDKCRCEDGVAADGPHFSSWFPLSNPLTLEVLVPFRKRVLY